MTDPKLSTPEREADVFGKLSLRLGDIDLPTEDLPKLISLFKNVKVNLGLKTNPDTMRLRHYDAQETICERGAAGNSAYFLLRPEDLKAVQQRLQDDMKKLEEEKRAHAAQPAAESAAELDQWQRRLLQMEEDLKRLRQHSDSLPKVLAQAELELQHPVAVARIPAAPLAVRRRQSFFQGLSTWVGLGAARKAPPRPQTIPNDGPTDIDYDSGEAPLYDGELFGEMACVDRQPRSATVIAVRECFVLEMLRPILDNLRKDAAYRKSMDEKYKDRVLELHLRQLPLFKDLDAEQMARVRQEVDLRPYEAGELICDEHECSDALYLIRSGTVKVMQNVSYLLTLKDVRSWPAALTLVPSQKHGHDAELKNLIWQRLSEPTRTALTGPDHGGSPESQQQLLNELNDIIRDPELCQGPAARALVHEQMIHYRSWNCLARPEKAAPRERYGLNRVLMGATLPGKLLAWKPTGAEQLPTPLTPTSVGDWKSLCTDLEPSQRKAELPATAAAHWLWNQLSPAVQSLIKQAKTGVALTPDQQQQVVAALNALVETAMLLLEPAFQDLIQADTALQARVMAVRQDHKKWTDHDYQRFNRARNCLLMRALYPSFLAPELPPPAPPIVLAYRGRGEFIGEMGLLLNQPRSATCVAYNHPDNDPAREVGPVQLVRIRRELFDHLKTTSDTFRKKIEATVKERQTHTAQRRREAAASRRQRSLPLSAESEELGLSQGQRLMLIDLDRCTRCDECVKACVATHDDGFSRLFLDGPRFQHDVGGRTRTFLAPTTCRSCVDPVCMIPCPVGSIHRGDQGQILIRDWCIGCEKCAQNCPYGAIQMHPCGVLPAQSPDWRFLPEWKLGQITTQEAVPAWCLPTFSDKKWLRAQTPIVCDRDFVQQLGPLPDGTAAACFRHTFDISRNVPRIKPDTKFRLLVTPPREGLQLWINGQPVTDFDVKKGLRELELALPAGAPATPSKALRVLQLGQNVVAARVPLPQHLGGELFELQIIIFEGTKLDLRAAVCDLCNQAPGQRTACEKACPHEATRRFDGRNGVLVW
jgi:Fe-S-cluster-containing dehydrogenase component/CRP-like cAMP-binding protein